jgi:hypothetical protein
MSGFAINGSSMRAVDSADDCVAGETFCTELPTPWPPAPDLDQMKAAKLATIAADFQAAANASVTDAGGAVWNGGFESAQAIYGAAQLAQAGGAASVTIFDAGNIGHPLTISQATAVAAVVGAAYQAAFAKYQGLKVKIAAATTAEAVQAIVW